MKSVGVQDKYCTMRKAALHKFALLSPRVMNKYHILLKYALDLLALEGLAALAKDCIDLAIALLQAALTIV